MLCWKERKGRKRTSLACYLASYRPTSVTVYSTVYLSLSTNNKQTVQGFVQTPASVAIKPRAARTGGKSLKFPSSSSFTLWCCAAYTSTQPLDEAIIS